MAEVVIQKIGRALAEVQIEGTAPLIVNRFSAKARQRMLDKQMGKTVMREPKNPEECFQASLSPLPGDRYGFPSTGFKAAIVGAARYFDNKKLSMTALKQMVFVKGEGSDMLVPIEGEPKMREDMVRNETGVADVRFRGEFWPWRAKLEIVYVRSLFGVDSLLSLVDAAGMGGIGEWRPASKKSHSGMYGTFAVVDDQDVKEILL